jgi:hypothetical protein
VDCLPVYPVVSGLARTSLLNAKHVLYFLSITFCYALPKKTFIVITAVGITTPRDKIKNAAECA